MSLLPQYQPQASPPSDGMNMGRKKPAAHPSISEDALKHLKTYKYSAVDQSWISNHILRHYWNGAVKLLPMSLAPNMVTLIGFMFIIANVALLQVMDPGLQGTAPGWVYYSYAFGLWAYSTMDNIDGKQARRTGTSSGLGELFDHGIDSLNCTLGSLLETSAMGLGPTKLGALAALIPTLPMFFSTWETYHSHTLFLGYFNGPTEGLIIACCLMLASGYFGVAIYHTSLHDLFGLQTLLGGAWTIADLLPYILLGSFLVAHLPSCVQNVVEARRKNNLPISSVFLEWTPMLVYSAATCIWLGSTSSIVLRENYLVLWCITQSFVFGRMTTKIILAHLTHRPFPMWTVLMAPLVGGAVLFGVLPTLLGTALGAGVERMYLWVYFVVAVVIYFRWAFLVIGAICDFLGIQCLTIPEEKQRANREAAARGKLS